VFLYPSGDRRRSRTISICCSAPDRLRRAKAAALHAQTDFLLERQERALLESVARALRRRHDVHRHDSPNSRVDRQSHRKTPGWERIVR